MVTGGNVTSLPDELEKSGHVARSVAPEDRRSFRVALTARGRRAEETRADGESATRACQAQSGAAVNDR